jgi:hypothetical protein
VSATTPEEAIQLLDVVEYADRCELRKLDHQFQLHLALTDAGKLEVECKHADAPHGQNETLEKEYPVLSRVLWGGTSGEDSYGGHSDDEDEPFVPPTPEQVLAAVEAERSRIPLPRDVEAKTEVGPQSQQQHGTPASLPDIWGAAVEARAKRIGEQ